MEGRVGAKSRWEGGGQPREAHGALVCQGTDRNPVDRWTELPGHGLDRFVVEARKQQVEATREATHRAMPTRSVTLLAREIQRVRAMRRRGSPVSTCAALP